MLGRRSGGRHLVPGRSALRWWKGKAGRQTTPKGSNIIARGNASGIWNDEEGKIEADVSEGRRQTLLALYGLNDRGWV
jgi:hypothetical protein